MLFTPSLPAEHLQLNGKIMAHFAKVVDGKVVNVIVAEPDFFDNFLDNSPGKWIQTSYNTHKNIHYGPDGQPDGGIALRGNYASIGGVYDEVNDVFYEQKPYPSWILNTLTWDWEAPIPCPATTRTNQWDPVYKWDEETQTWVDSLSEYYKDLI